MEWDTVVIDTLVHEEWVSWLGGERFSCGVMSDWSFYHTAIFLEGWLSSHHSVLVFFHSMTKGFENHLTFLIQSAFTSAASSSKDSTSLFVHFFDCFWATEMNHKGAPHVSTYHMLIILQNLTASYTWYSLGHTSRQASHKQAGFGHTAMAC